ncbi:MAG: DUF5719 family protein [Propionibacteriaceae bacterium]|nr:DUF5719 family protein [Propionibacteriaceae bacterium]
MSEEPTGTPVPDAEFSPPEPPEAATPASPTSAFPDRLGTAFSLLRGRKPQSRRSGGSGDAAAGATPNTEKGEVAATAETAETAETAQTSQDETELDTTTPPVAHAKRGVTPDEEWANGAGLDEDSDVATEPNTKPMRGARTDDVVVDETLDDEVLSEDDTAQDASEDATTDGSAGAATSTVGHYARRVMQQVKTPMQVMLGTTDASKQHPPLEALIGVILLVVGALVVALVSKYPQAPQTVMPKADIRLVCPGFEAYPGTISAQVKGGANYSVVGADSAETAKVGQFDITDVKSPSSLAAVTGASELVARLTITDGTRTAATNCSAPLASQYLLFPDAAGSTLQIANPDASVAVYNVTIIGPKGEITGEQLRDARLAPNSVMEYNLSDYVKDEGSVGIRVQNTHGRLLATGLVTNGGLDLISASNTGLSLVAAGIPTLASVKVVLTNPATVRVTASIKALTDTGVVGLAGVDAITIEASQSKVVDVSEAMLGLGGALQITANNGIAASAVVGYADDVAVIPAIPFTHLVAEPLLSAAAPPMTLTLANVSEAAADVQLSLFTATGSTETTVTLPASSTLATPIPEGVIRVGLEVPQLVAYALAQDESGLTVTNLPTEVRDIGRTPLKIVVR